MNEHFEDLSARALFTFDSTTRQQESDFFLVEPDSHDQGASNPKAAVYCEALLRHRVLFLFCSPEMEIRPLLLYLAGHVQTHLQRHDAARLDILEWSKTHNLNRLEAVLHSQEKPSLLLFDDLDPKHCRLSLDRLRHATRHRHYIIVGSKATRRQWGLDQTADGCFELEPRSLFDSDALLGQLDRLLKLYRHQLPLQLKDAPQDGPLFEGYDQPTFAMLAEKLNTPFKVDAYVSFLKQTPASLQEQDLLTWMDRVGGGPEDLINWYRMQSRDTQVLGLALSLFGSLYTDQFFAVVERLTAKLWREQIPGLKSYDYWDLEFYRPYFGFQKLEDGSIAPYRPEYAAWLLDAGLERFPRFVIANLQHLIDLAVAASSTNHPSGGIFSETAMTEDPDDVPRVHQFRELFGHPKHWNNMRCRKLRATIVETLSKLFLKMPKAVEPCLAIAACQEQVSVQQIAAQVLVVRQSDDVQAMFDGLDAWLTDEAKRRQLVKMSPGLAEDTAGVRLNQAVAMATLHIQTDTAAFDTVKNRFITHLDRISHIRERSVTTLFCEQVLPKLIVRDTDLLLAQIIEWSGRYKLAKGLGLGLAELLNQEPKRGLAILKNLESRLPANLPDEETYPNASESRAVVSALVYGHANLDALSPQQRQACLTRLLHIYRLSPRRLIRQAVFISLARQYRHCESLRPEIETFAGTLERRDLEQAFATYVEIQFERLAPLNSPAQDEVARLGRQVRSTFESRPHAPLEALEFLGDHAKAALVKMLLSWCAVTNQERYDERGLRRLTYLWLLVHYLVDILPNAEGDSPLRMHTRLLTFIEKNTSDQHLKETIQMAMVRRMVHHKADFQLEQAFLDELHPGNLERAAQRLFGLFQEERAGFEGGDAFVEINFQKIPIWLHTSRPTTKLESFIATWRDRQELPQAQNLELLVRNMIFRHYEIEEARLVEQMKHQVMDKGFVPEPQAPSLPPFQPSFMRRMLLFIAVGFHKSRFGYLVGKMETIRRMYERYREEDKPTKENGWRDVFRNFVYPEELQQNYPDMFKAVGKYSRWAGNEGCFVIVLVFAALVLLSIGASFFM